MTATARGNIPDGLLTAPGPKVDLEPTLAWLRTYSRETLAVVDALAAKEAELAEARAALRLVLGAHGDHREGMDPNYLCECASCQTARRALSVHNSRSHKEVP